MYHLEWGLCCPEKRPQVQHAWIGENLNVAESSSSYVGECSSDALFSLFLPTPRNCVRHGSTRSHASLRRTPNLHRHSLSQLF